MTTIQPNQLISNKFIPSITIGVLALYAYLIFVNLDYAPLFIDEAFLAFVSRNLLELGAPYAFDGRNIITWSYSNSDLHNDLTYKYPQFIFYALATMFYLFGDGEIQARTLAALFALAAMVLFWDCLRREFPQRPGFIIVALSLACFSPLILLYSRNANYHAAALFFAILLFRLYLAYQSRPLITTAGAMLVVAVAGFHTHYLINIIFVTTLALFHLCFRMSSFNRKTLILVIGGILYTAQALWFTLLNANSFVRYIYTASQNSNEILFFNKKEKWLEALANSPHWYEFVTASLFKGLLVLNQNSILYWSIIMLFIAQYCYQSFQKGLVESSQVPGLLTRIARLRADKVWQYLMLVIIITVVTTLVTLYVHRKDFAITRFLITTAPFAAVISAEVICRTWQYKKIAGLALGMVMSVSSLCGYPFAWHVTASYSPRWTLPALAVEFHRDYPGPLRASLNWLNEHTKQNDLVCPALLRSQEITYYLSEKIYICGMLSRTSQLPSDIQAAGREYLFREDIHANKVQPHWLAFFGTAPNLKELSFADNHYRLVKEFAVFKEETGGFQRPEPYLHDSFPPSILGIHDKIAFYRREDTNDT